MLTIDAIPTYMDVAHRPFSAAHHPEHFQAEVRGTTALDEIQSRSLNVPRLKHGCLRAPDPIQNGESAETPSLINEAPSCKPVSVEYHQALEATHMGRVVERKMACTASI
ncbi:hypothetical protein [Burkholderia stagnalis]|uniref:hypothetical protein n=1 Tax=Burkholderia stagnalis TaxID=1503054 RepID=UPI0012D9D670|nr:hypothetical protein [Burkholderia stagnalis]